jgi:homoserine O-acetyltransferase
VFLYAGQLRLFVCANIRNHTLPERWFFKTKNAFVQMFEFQMADFELFSLGDIELQCGSILVDAKIAYKTYGSLNSDKSNVIVYPSWFTGFISDNEWLIGSGKALDPEKYFILVVCAFGNGQSSSPSNHPSQGGSSFPAVSLYDNVTQQHRLVSQHFGISKVALVVGWSMGAQQTFQWAALYPDMVQRICPFAGSAKTSPHNFVFLEGVKAGLVTDAAWNGGAYGSSNPTHGLRAVGRVYAGWGLTQQFYRLELWRQLGFTSLEDFLVVFWEGFFLKRDANNLLLMLATWQGADISDNPKFKGDLVAALKAIRAKTLVLSPENDLYFPKEDNFREVETMQTANPNVECVVIPGDWGHFAGGGINQDDTHFIDEQLRRLLAKSA